MTYHIPVLLEETLEALITNPDGVYIDVTFGGGGHSRAILNALSEKGRLIAFDQDQDALNNRIDDPRFTLIHSNFRFIKNYASFYKFEQVDGILADLGVSSHQFDTPERGFSIRFDGPLDMRMNQSQKSSAKELLNTYSEAKLLHVFEQHADLPNARKLVQAILTQRAINPIQTTFELLELTKPLCQQSKAHTYNAQVFQALRMEVNEELQALKDFLMATPHLLQAEGRLVVLAYHSIEDRMVKNFMKSGNVEGIIEKDFFGRTTVPFKILKKSLAKENLEERSQNNRSRSAVLRVVEKK
jgi:16S rRNA (cytosine1402-N4)-methyltransferase